MLEYSELKEAVDDGYISVYSFLIILSKAFL